MIVTKNKKFKVGSAFILTRYPSIPEDIKPYGYKVDSYKSFLDNKYSLKITVFEKNTKGIIVETAKHNHHIMILALIGKELYLVDWNFIKIIT